MWKGDILRGLGEVHTGSVVLTVAGCAGDDLVKFGSGCCFFSRYWTRCSACHNTSRAFSKISDSRGRQCRFESTFHQMSVISRPPFHSMILESMTTRLAFVGFGRHDKAATESRL
ncbi:hypothetical protein M426DRAFT_251611 [Hypoxylon sp. CI-4A]|nr:hypothetical protein M426DRAFT_251611 [Hypoxylon sp. CI-4A]